MEWVLLAVWVVGVPVAYAMLWPWVENHKGYGDLDPAVTLAAIFGALFWPVVLWFGAGIWIVKAIRDMPPSDAP